MSTISRTMTEEEFLGLPEVEGLERELIRGELRERVVTTRAYAHSIVTCNICLLLKSWLKLQPAPRGAIVGGEARVRLSRGPLTFVGVDVAYISSRARPEHPRKAGYVDGPPILVVEVLSPYDKLEDINDKVDIYLEAGVLLVWIVEPRHSIVTVHRPDAKPQLFNIDQELTAEPHLPGFRARVAELFEDLDD